MKPIVVKVGGSTLGSHDTALEDIAALHAEGRPLIVVHGGGSAATEWLKLHGVATEFVDGLRVTGSEAIEVVAAVFTLVNKQLVGQLMALGAKAFGLAGPDGGLLATRQASERLGFVGEVTRVDTRPVATLLEAGYLPVVAPLGFWDQRPEQLMNVNADTAAGEVAAALKSSDLVFLTDVASVRDGSGAPIAELSASRIEELIASGVASGGMVPKLRACARAASAGVRCQIVDGRESHALRAVIDGRAAGTRVAA